MTEEVLSRFARMAGLTEEEAPRWADLCGDVERELTDCLRPGADLERQSGTFFTACAALAFYRYQLASLSTGEDSFSAGDLKVTKNPAAALSMAERLWRESRAAAAGLFRDEAFLFRRTRP